MQLKIVAVIAASLVVMSQSPPAWAEAARISDPSAFVIRQSGTDKVTGTIRSTTTRAGGSNSSTPTRASGQRPVGGQQPLGQSPSSAGSNAAGGGGMMLLTNFIPNSAAGGVTVAPVVLARQAAATLQLPRQTIRVGPDPSDNHWNMLAVGYPLWLWREGASTSNQSVSLGGAALSMTATYRSTTYDMGDGTRVTCTVSTPWVAAAQSPGTPSPTCGHSYARPGSYTIRATHSWDLAWSGMGQSGSFPLTNVSSNSIEVGELASIVIGR